LIFLRILFSFFFERFFSFSPLKYTQKHLTLQQICPWDFFPFSLSLSLSCFFLLSSVALSIYTVALVSLFFHSVAFFFQRSCASLVLLFSSLFFFLSLLLTLLSLVCPRNERQPVSYLSSLLGAAAAAPSASLAAPSPFSSAAAGASAAAAALSAAAAAAAAAGAAAAAALSAAGAVELDSAAAPAGFAGSPCTHWLSAV
jgi:hypothetical protein